MWIEFAGKLVNFNLVLYFGIMTMMGKYRVTAIMVDENSEHENYDTEELANTRYQQLKELLINRQGNP